MEANSLVKTVEEIIKKTEISNHQFTFFEHPKAPIVVIYADEKAIEIHNILISSLKNVWATYEKKIIFAKLCDEKRIEYIAGLAGTKNDHNTLFEKDSNFTGFDYSRCTVFLVTSTYGLSSQNTIYQQIKIVDTTVADILSGRIAIKYLVALLDMSNPISAGFRKECEQIGNECLNDKKVFFIENRGSDGADLTDEISEAKLFKNLSYIIRTSQLPGIKVSNGLHLVGSQEVHKPYYEMSAGTIAGVVERIGAYITAHINNLQNRHIATEKIASDLGFNGDNFEYVEQKKSSIQKFIPTSDAFALMPLSEPREPNVEASAEIFNKQTMGGFFAYVDSIDIGKSDIVTLDGYIEYLKKKLTCFDILGDLGIDSRISETIGYIKNRTIQKAVKHLSPAKYMEQFLMDKCKEELLSNILEKSAKTVLDCAKHYIDSVNQICQLVFPHGKEDIYNFYKKKAIDSITDSDLSSIGTICDPDQWVVSFIKKIINSDTMYSLSLEDELAKRIGHSASISGTVVGELQSENQYFSSSINYSTNVDVAGRILFMDKESELWNSIENHLGTVTIFNMPENNEINLLKIYTYRKV